LVGWGQKVWPQTLPSNTPPAPSPLSGKGLKAHNCNSFEGYNHKEEQLVVSKKKGNMFDSAARIDFSRGISSTIDNRNLFERIK
jgi:hypothetical protein